MRGSWLTVGPKADAEWKKAVKARTSPDAKGCLMGTLVGFPGGRFGEPVDFQGEGEGVASFWVHTDAIREQ